MKHVYLVGGPLHGRVCNVNDGTEHISFAVPDSGYENETFHLHNADNFCMASYLEQVPNGKFFLYLDIINSTKQYEHSSKR